MKKSELKKIVLEVLNERAFRLQGKKPIIISVIEQNFVKLIKNVTNENDAISEWKKFAVNQAPKIIVSEVFKRSKLVKEDIVGIDALLKNLKWSLRDRTIYAEMVINVAVADDINVERVAKNIGGYTTFPLNSNNEKIYGVPINSDDQNIEIRGMLEILVENK